MLRFLKECTFLILLDVVLFQKLNCISWNLKFGAVGLHLKLFGWYAKRLSVYDNNIDRSEKMKE